MSIWDRLASFGRTTGVWESGTRVGKKLSQISKGHQQKKWDFTNHHERRFGRGFYKALKRMPMTEYKKIILDLVRTKEKYNKLTEKQWNYLGFLMTKADPGCLENPRIIINKKKSEVVETPKVILRKKSLAVRPKADR